MRPQVIAITITVNIKIELVNAELKEFLPKEIELISHEAINYSHFNRGGLHLDQRGDGALACNFISTRVWMRPQVIAITITMFNTHRTVSRLEDSYHPNDGETDTRPHKSSLGETLNSAKGQYNTYDKSFKVLSLNE